MTRGKGNLQGPQKLSPRVRRAMASLNESYASAPSQKVNNDSDYTILPTDTLVISDGNNGGAANAELDLPSVDDVEDFHTITIKNADPLGTHALSVNTDGSEVIDASTTTLTINQWQSYTLMCANNPSGTRQWFIIGKVT